jgi:hypothetical protein
MIYEIMVKAYRRRRRREKNKKKTISFVLSDLGKLKRFLDVR